MDLYIYICDDRSSQNHIDSIVDYFTQNNFTNYEIITCNDQHYGYGYVLNTALDKAYQYSDVALTMEDDWILLHEFNITPLVNFLLNSNEYVATRLCARNSIQYPYTTKNLPNFYSKYEKIPKNYCFFYCLQCMLRHKKIYQKIRFLENVLPHVVEIDIMKNYTFDILKTNIEGYETNYYILPHNKPVFTHIGKKTSIPHSLRRKYCNEMFKFIRQ